MSDNTNDAARIRERFLDRISQTLTKDMSIFERDDTIREIRSHLVACAAAYEELGLDSCSAMKAAIERFGNVKEIEKQLRKECRTVWPSYLAPTLSLLISFAIGSVLMTVSDFLIYLTHEVSNPSEGMWLVGGVLGGLIGLAIYRRPRKPLIAGLRAAVIVPTTLLAVVSAMNHRVPDIQFLLIFLFGFGASAFVIAALSALGIQIVEREMTRSVQKPTPPTRSGFDPKRGETGPA